MDFKTPTLIFLGFLLAAFSLAVLGLAADNISFINHQLHDGTSVDVHYFRYNTAARKPYAYWVTMEYLPSNFSMGALDAMIATAVVSLIASIWVAISAWRVRSEKAPKNIASLVVASIAFLLNLAVAIYTWYPSMISTLDFLKDLPTPPTGGQTAPVTLNSHYTFTSESWNCLLAQFAVEPREAATLMNACQEAKVTNYMMIPVLLLSAGLLASVSWSWYSARRSAAAEQAQAASKEADQVSMESA